MTWGKSLLVMAVAWMMPVAAFAAGSQMVVIGVTGSLAQYKVGQQIEAGSSLKLPADTTLRLLSANGQVIALKGPYNGPATAKAAAGPSDPQVIARLSKFLGERQVLSRTLGTVRSGPPRTREPTDALMVLVGDRGSQCAQGPKVTLWRKNAEKDSTLEIGAGSGGPAKLGWSKGTNAVDLPSRFVKDKGTLDLKLDGVPSSVNLHLAPASLRNPAALADWMVRENCVRQAALFLGSLE